MDTDTYTLMSTYSYVRTDTQTHARTLSQHNAKNYNRTHKHTSKRQQLSIFQGNDVSMATEPLHSK